MKLSEDVTCSLNLLLFSVGDIPFGMDAEQALSMAAHDGEEADDLFWFHEELGWSSGAYRAPTIISIETEHSSYRVIIDMMESIVEVGIDEIHPFPRLVEPFSRLKGMWGLMIREGRMVVLVDFKRLFDQKDAAAVTRGSGSSDS